MKHTHIYTTLLFFFFSFAVVKSNAQIFEQHAFSEQFPDVVFSSVQWADVNADGKMDVFIMGGNDDSIDHAKLFFQTEDGFVEQTTDIKAIHMGGADFLDFNQDGFPDLFMHGQTYTQEPFTKLYLNNKEGGLKEVTTKVDALFNSNSSWSDFDNDGDLDLVICGAGNSEGMDWINVTKVYENQGGNLIEYQALEGVMEGAVDWGDANNDGLLDILVTGIGNDYENFTAIYLQEEGVFTQSTISLPQLGYSAGKFFDPDRDGDMDIILFGSNPDGDSETHFFLNNNHEFQKVTTSITGLNASSASNKIAVADYNNDGTIDVLLTGSDTDYNYSTLLYAFKDGNFEKVEAGLEPLGGNGSVAFCDFDGDYDLDILSTGYDNSSLEPTTILYENKMTLSPSTLLAPEGLKVEVVGNDVLISWNQSSDVCTYNLRVGTESDSQVIVSANEANRNYTLAKEGNCGIKTERRLVGLTDGEYTCSVQMVDNRFAAGAFAENVTFKVGEAASIEEHIKSSASIAPNPAKDFVVITSYDEVHDYTIYNMQGVLQRNDSVYAKQFTIAIDDLSKGTYILHLNSSTKKEILKIVKQ